MAAGTAVPSPVFGPLGFQAPAGPAVLAGVQADISAAFGVALNFNLNTPQGQLASSEAASISNAYGIFAWQSQQFDPAYAVGRNLDALARIYGLERDPAEPTTLQVLCTGAGAFLPDQSNPTVTAATIVDRAGNLYQCLSAGTLPAGGGSITISFACTVPGPVGVPAASAVAIYQAIPGWNSVSVVSGVQGTLTESNAAFRQRRADTVAGNSAGSVGAIIGAVAAVPGVIDYYGNANPTASPVTIGGVTIPAYSTYICVAGGAPSAVAAAILSKKSPGSPLTGNTTLTVFDTNPLYVTPIPYTITYQIPAALQVLYKVVIASSALVPANATQLVQAALLAAFEGASLSATFTGSIAGTTLTVSSVVSGTIVVGQALTDITNALAVATTITGLGTGTGGIGTYSVSVAQTVPSEPMSANPPPTAVVPPRARIAGVLYATQYAATISSLGQWAQLASLAIGSANTPGALVTGHISGSTLTVTAVTSGTVAVGQNVTDPLGLTVAATYVAAFLGGSGGTGTYTVNNPQTVAGATFTGTGSGTNLTASAVTGVIGIGNVITGSGVPALTTIVSQTSGTPGGAGVYVTNNATTSAAAALAANSPITLAAANQSLVSVQLNQVPQLVAANIAVSTT